MSRPLDVSTLPPSLQLLHQKQQEYASLQALREESARLVERVEKLAEMSNVMADGGAAIGSVLASWPYVFKILEQIGEGRAPAPTEDADEEAVPVMVRLPYTNESEDK
ncbi:DASH complex subunit dad2 [Vanrija pseudolonga]|uniref:DASH complex subunit DAD2 n=1 Tax=Vanrija pseudolonga TaxID=143232 RepID=A0AAF1BLB6_9TREE|nr:DASH complex subunit dad2 [Vanrija pseudolonga]